MASSTVCTLTQAGRPGKKCSNSPYKWHPERLVSQRTTLIPMPGLHGQSLTPTYTVNGKVTFEKWAPHCDLIHWLTPGRRGFSPGGGGAIETEITLHFGLDLHSASFLTFTQTHCQWHWVHTHQHTHTGINSNSISSWDEVGSNKQGGVRMHPVWGLGLTYSWSNKYSHG